MEEDLTNNTTNQSIDRDNPNIYEQIVQGQNAFDKQAGTEELLLADKNLTFNNYIKKALNLPDTDIKTYSPLTLAFIGDSVFDLIIRTYVVESGNAPVNKLHHKCSKLVQAGAQAELYHSIKDKLTEEEMAIFKRGRNAKSFTSAKNAGLLEYRTATGIEALIGYLYLTGRIDRIMELIKQHLINNNMNT